MKLTEETVLLIPWWYSRICFCVVVYLRACWSILVARHSLSWRWLEICEEEVAHVLALLRYAGLWRLYLCWGTLRDHQVVDRSLCFWCRGTPLYLLIVLKHNTELRSLTDESYSLLPLMVPELRFNVESRLRETNTPSEYTSMHL